MFEYIDNGLVIATMIAMIAFGLTIDFSSKSKAKKI